MKKSICLLLVIFSCFAACKKEQDVLEIGPKPQPQAENPTKAGEFLKALKVTGAEDITFDTISNSYMVSLPEGFNAEKAEVRLSMHSNIGLVDKSDAITADSIINYAYQGTTPLSFELREKSGRGTFYFMVYFNFSGTPDVTLLQKEIPINSMGIKFPLQFNAQVGSIPASPTQPGPLVKIINTRTGYATESQLYAGDYRFVLEGMHGLLTDDPIKMEVHFVDQKPVVFDGIKFVRDTPMAFIWPAYKFQFTRKDSIHVTGGFFAPVAKYTITISSDFLEKPITSAMRFHDYGKISLDKLPAGLPEGSYLLSFYEDGKLISKSSFHHSNFETACLESIWKGSAGESVERSVTPPSFNRGDVFYAKSQPVIYGTGSTSFDVNRLPKLRLKSPEKTVDLVPELEVFHWGIAGVSYALGKYKIPADLPATKYAVSGIYANRYETQPYWSKLEVK